MITDYLLEHEIISRKEKFKRIFRPSISPAEQMQIRERIFECNHNVPNEKWAIYWDWDIDDMVQDRKMPPHIDMHRIRMCDPLDNDSTKDDVEKAFRQTTDYILDMRRSKTPIYRIYYKIYSLLYSIYWPFKFVKCTKCGRRTRNDYTVSMNTDENGEFVTGDPKCNRCTGYKPIDLKDCVEF